MKNSKIKKSRSYENSYSPGSLKLSELKSAKKVSADDIEDK